LANCNWAQVSKKAGRPGWPPIRRQLRELIRTMTGLTASDRAEKVRAVSGESDSAYGARRGAYDIKKLRGKSMVPKIGASRRYEPLPEGLRAMTALGGPARTVIRPLLAASTRPEPDSKLSNPTPAIRTTKTSAPARAASSLSWGWQLKIDNLFFHPFG
jgi:hypothetical protein